MSVLDEFRPTTRNPWDKTLAAHLLNRAGFGGVPDEITRVAGLGPRRAVSELIEFAGNPDTSSPPALPESLEGGRRALRDLPPEERREQLQLLMRAHREAIQAIRGWWIKRMLANERPLQEKLTLFWHGHFATSAQEVKNARHMFQQNEFLRAHCLGNFRDLVLGISRDPAMLRYLDNNTNRRGKPNENYARELLELFTMGIGNYTEEDVAEAARAFTGWTFRPGEDEFFFNRRDHDYGPKTFLGETGHFDGADIIDRVLKQPATARFISRKLFEFFVFENPEPALVEELAARLRDANYELKPWLDTLLRARIFYSPRAIRTQIKSPAQLVVGATRGLEVSVGDRALAVAMRSLGQDLLFPPNVAGWPGGEAWINTTTLMMRYNITRYLITGGLPPSEGDSRPSEDSTTRQLRRARPRNKLATIVPNEVAVDPARVVSALVARLLQSRLDARAQEWLVEQALRVPSRDRAAVVAHLIMSMPDYQLC